MDRETFEIITQSQIGKMLLGKYRIEEGIGFGGFGIVFRCKEMLGSVAVRDVAVKKIARSNLKGANIDLFFQEVKTMTTLGQHPNILQFITADIDDQALYLVTEYADGKTLLDYLDEKKYLTEPEAVGIILQVLQGIEHVHSVGIIHRDLKPANIFRLGDVYKVGDFGVSKFVGPEASTFTAVGSPFYMAREQLLPEMRYSKNVDIYAAGVVLFEMLTGRKPFRNLKEICNEVPVSVPSSISEELRDVLHKALHKDPAARYQNCGEMIHDLEKAIRLGRLHQVSPADDQTGDLDKPRASEPIQAYYDQREKAAVATRHTPTSIPPIGEGTPSAPISSTSGGVSASQLPQPSPKKRLQIVGGIALISLLLGILGIVYREYERLVSTDRELVKRAVVTSSASSTPPAPPNEVARLPQAPLPAERMPDPSQAPASSPQGSARSLERRASRHAQEAQIERWLAKAAYYQRKKQYLTPPGKECAHYWIEKVLAVDPENVEALELQSMISDTYLKWAELSLARKDFAKAADYAKKAMKFVEGHPEAQKIIEQARQGRELIPTSFDASRRPSRRRTQVPLLEGGMMFIPGANFTRENGETIYVPGFYIDIYEFPNMRGKKPYTNVSWYEARNYCMSVGKRLCTDVEWEKACRGLEELRYPYGDRYEPGTCRTNLDPEAGPVASGAIPSCFSNWGEYGIFDMSGNVWEWTESRTPGNNRIAKGGGWSDRPDAVSCTNRIELTPHYTHESGGFRCCK